MIHGSSASQLSQVSADPRALEVLRQVCERWSISRERLLGKDRHWVSLWPRYVAMEMVLESTGCQRMAIARLFGRTPSGITRALQQAADLEQTSKRARSDLEIMRLRLDLPTRHTPTPRNLF